MDHIVDPRHAKSASEPPRWHGRSLWLRISGWFFISLAVACVLLEALLIIGAIVTSTLRGAALLAFPLILAVSCGQFGLMVLARSRRETLAGPRGFRLPLDEQPAGAGREPLRAESLGAPPVNPSGSYREACSQLSAGRPLVALALLAAAVWLVTIVGGQFKPGPQGFLLLLAVAPGFYLLGVLLYLPYGIVLGDGWLRVGARGVPSAGRVWRRQAIPLDAIICWNVLSMRELKARKRILLAGGNRFTGNMLGPGVRHVCWLKADPARIKDSFPEQIMTGDVFSDSARQGYVRTGYVVIGTRNPRALSRALQEALPGRRADISAGWEA